MENTSKRIRWQIKSNKDNSSESNLQCKTLARKAFLYKCKQKKFFFVYLITTFHLKFKIKQICDATTFIVRPALKDWEITFLGK